MEYREIKKFNRDLKKKRTEPITEEVLPDALYSYTGFSGEILLTSGRISSEILSKALRCLMPVIAADGVLTTQTLNPTRKAGLSIAGRVRGSRMVVKSSKESIRSSCPSA